MMEAVLYLLMSSLWMMDYKVTWLLYTRVLKGLREFIKEFKLEDSTESNTECATTKVGLTTPT